MLAGICPGQSISDLGSPAASDAYADQRLERSTAARARSERRGIRKGVHILHNKVRIEHEPHTHVVHRLARLERKADLRHVVDRLEIGQVSNDFEQAVAPAVAAHVYSAKVAFFPWTARVSACKCWFGLMCV